MEVGFQKPAVSPWLLCGQLSAGPLEEEDCVPSLPSSSRKLLIVADSKKAEGRSEARIAIQNTLYKH